MNMRTPAQSETQLSRIVDRFKGDIERKNAPQLPTPEPISAPVSETHAQTPELVATAPVRGNVTASAPSVKPVVSTYTPAPEVMEEERPYTDWEEALQTALTWVENEQIDGTPRDRKTIAFSLRAVADWIE